MACGVHDNLPEPEIVSVNGVEIPRDIIAREVQHHPAPKAIEAWQSAARALAIRELLLQQARYLKIVPAPLNEESGPQETDEEALIQGLIEREVATPDPDDAACRRYYEQNKRRFRSPPIYAATHILFSVRQDDPEGYAKTQALAQSVLAELKQNPERFEELAREHSACPSAAQGGALGQISVGQTTPEFEKALEALAPGAMTETPVETPYGLHIIRLDDKVEGKDLPFDLVADHIAGYLRENVTHRATAQYIARLVSSAEIAGIDLAGAEAHQVS
ncbi:MAG: peptidylprolyl isomerase [Methyloceanibacter sp.]